MARVVIDSARHTPRRRALSSGSLPLGEIPRNAWRAARAIRLSLTMIDAGGSGPGVDTVEVLRARAGPNSFRSDHLPLVRTSHEGVPQRREEEGPKARK